MTTPWVPERAKRPAAHPGGRLLPRSPEPQPTGKVALL